VKNFGILIRILAPPFICILVIYITGSNLISYPLVFGLCIGLVNWYYHKFNPILGVFISIVLSFTIFLIGFFGYGFWKNLLEIIKNFMIPFQNNWSIPDSAYILTTFIISPLLVFFAYKFIFNFPKSKFTLLIIVLSIAVLILIGLFQTDDNKHNIMNHYNLWQFVMILSLQLIITQRDFKKFMEMFQGQQV